MSTSPNLNLPFVAAGQAQKHVTVNESLVLIDSLMHIAVDGPPSDTPPPDPAEGGRWLVGADPQGAWDGQAGRLAVFLDGGWRFHAARTGWIAHRADSHGLLGFDGVAWSELAQPEILQNLDLLGVGTTADASNPLSAKLNNVLFSAKTAAEGGDGDLRFKVNKETAGDTASLLYQTGFSGRAEMGLTGSDDFVLKVSDDGSAWTEALKVDGSSGAVTGRVFDSVQLTIGPDAVGQVNPPSAGGIVLLSLVDPNYPQNPANAIFAYDVGASPGLTTMVVGSAIENKGTTTLTGTTSTAGKVGVAVDGLGRLFIENRFTGGGTHQFCLTFVNSWRAI